MLNLLYRASMPAIPLYKRSLIVKLNERGESLLKISKDLKVSRCAIRNIIKKFKEGYGLHNKSKICTPEKLSQREKNNLIINSKKNRFLTANELRRECDIADKVSVSTVKRVLRKGKLFGRVAIKKPHLTSKQMKKRMLWCNKRRSWVEIDWNKIIFTDESKIELFPRRRQYVRRNLKEALRPSVVLKTKKFSPYVMFWGGIRADGKRFIKRFCGTVDSFRYQAILDEALPMLYSNRHIWQQDGATCHSSASTLKYLTDKCIRTIDDWPAQSADLSPIENLWDYLKDKVKDRQPKCLDELWRYTEEEFHAIPNDYISKLYKSMPNRMAAVLRAKGGNTKY